MRPVAFGEALPAGTRLTLVSDDKPHCFFTAIRSWMDATSGVALDLEVGIPNYQVEDGMPRRRLAGGGGRQDAFTDSRAELRMRTKGYASVWLAPQSLCPAEPCQAQEYRLRLNVPEHDYSSFYRKAVTGGPLLCAEVQRSS
jgi:hypothetical protein